MDEDTEEQEYVMYIEWFFLIAFPDIKINCTLKIRYSGYSCGYIKCLQVSVKIKLFYDFKAYQHGIVLFEGAEAVKRCCIGSHHIALGQWIDGAAFCFHNPDNIS